MSGPRLDAHLEVLALALKAYLHDLRQRWSGATGDGTDTDVARIVAGVGARPAVDEADRDRVHMLLATTGTEPLVDLTAAAGLSPGEEALVAAAWWSETDPQVAVVLGCAHDDGARRFASPALMRRILEPYGIECPYAVEGGSPLVRFGVVGEVASATGPLVLTPTARLLLAGGPVLPLAAGHTVPARLTHIVDALSRCLEEDHPPVVELRGPDVDTLRATAVAAITAANRLPTGGDRTAGELRLLVGAANAVPVVDGAVAVELGWRPIDGPLVALGSPDTAIPGALVVDVGTPNFTERERLWLDALADTPVEPTGNEELAAALAARFSFTERDVAETGVRARADAVWKDRPLTTADIWDAARRQPEHTLERLAALVTPAFSLDDLVLDPEPMAQLHELIAHVELQHVVLDRWGFRRRLPRGQGVIALFTGPPGTGKTTAAEAVADALHQDLYVIDLSSVVSKYIGETEKNLAVAFDEAEKAGAVLFFDEADSLFGKRTEEVRDADDRYANLEVNYLLQRIETFIGLVLLATNRPSALDEAFGRRLRFMVRFDPPDRERRTELWQRSFPFDIGDVDWEALSEPELTGGSIQSVALAAAFLAASGGGAVTSDHIEHALRREHDKLGKWFAGLPGAGPVTPQLRLRVDVATPPAPGLLRPAIERRLGGDAFPGPVEDAVGRAVAEAVAAAVAGHLPEPRAKEHLPWR